MPENVRVLLQLVNIYRLRGIIYVVPMVEEEYCIWKPVEPIIELQKPEQPELEVALEMSWPYSCSFNATKPVPLTLWDGKGGEVWRVASNLWAVGRYNDDTTALTPNILVVSELVDEDTEPRLLLDGQSWEAVYELQTSFPSNKAASAIAALISEQINQV